jgi:hypothetical protein
MPFISINFEAIPNYLHGLVDRDVVARELFFVELVIELLRIKLLPINLEDSRRSRGHRNRLQGKDLARRERADGLRGSVKTHHPLPPGEGAAKRRVRGVRPHKA